MGRRTVFTRRASSEGEVVERGEVEEEEKEVPANSTHILRAWREDWAMEISESRIKKRRLERR